MDTLLYGICGILLSFDGHMTCFHSVIIINELSASMFKFLCEHVFTFLGYLCRHGRQVAYLTFKQLFNHFSKMFVSVDSLSST